MHLPSSITYRITDALINANNAPQAEFHCRPGQLLSQGAKSQIRDLIHRAARDPDESDTITIAATLTLDQGRQLAQFLKRLSYDSAKRHCSEMEDPSTILSACNILRESLADSGYSTR
jgi:hypothetical protein